MGNTKSRLFLYLLTGVILGYFLLHPASYLIIDLSQGDQLDFSRILARAFTVDHLIMAMYFGLLGGVLGVMFFLYNNLEKRINRDISELNTQIGHQVENLIEDMDSDSEDLSIFIKQIWPVLNQIRVGVNIISEEKMEINTRHRHELLDITKENIASVFSLIDVMLAYRQEIDKHKS